MKKQIQQKQSRTFNKLFFNPILLIALLISTFSFGQNPDNVKKIGFLTFETETIDYGTIVQNANGERVFTFKNTGESPILISKVKASCGCTVPTYPKAPIMPGETASIDIKYATSRLGKFSKTITVFSNANETEKKLVIKGNVVTTSKS